MERYTHVTEEGEVLFHPEELPDDEGFTITQLAMVGRYDYLEEIAEMLANTEQRLKRYEDTGLTPEQITELNNFEKTQCTKLLAQLQKYQRAEEEGTILRVPTAKGNIVWEIIMDDVSGNYIQGIEVQEVSDSRIWANDACFDYDDIGKTIFLLPKQAEKKLAEMEDGHAESH